MDPLSITSGIIAVLSASGKTAQGLEKIWGLHHRDKHFHDLSLTIEGLRIQFQSTVPVLNHIQTNHDDISDLQEGLQGIKNLCEETKSTFAKLDKIIENIRPKGARKPRKTLWIHRKAELIRLKEQAKNNTISLTNSLSMFSNIHSLTKIGILHSWLEVSTHVTAQGHARFPLTEEHGHPLVIGLASRTPSVESFYTIDCEAELKTSEKSTLDPVSSTTTEINYKRNCQCNCHLISRVTSPVWIQHILGSLTFHKGGSALLGCGACDEKECCKSGTIYMQMRYMAPSWTFVKVLVLCVQASGDGWGFYSIVQHSCS